MSSDILKDAIKDALIKHGFIALFSFAFLGGIIYIYNDNKAERIRHDDKADAQTAVILEISRTQSRQSAESIQTIQTINKQIEANTEAVKELSRVAEAAHKRD